jgi:hypothetical protein
MNQINTFIFTVLRISIYTLGNNKKYLHTGATKNCRHVCEYKLRKIFKNKILFLLQI